jgi:hypothetical protein
MPSESSEETCDYWNCEEPRGTDHYPGIRYCLIHEELGA